MAVSPFDSDLAGALLSDTAAAARFSDAAAIAAMLRVEAALARVQGRLGVIPATAADRIAAAAESLEVAPRDLAPAMAAAGVPVPALVRRLRAAAASPAANYVHWGATSQDIVDTGLVLRLAPLTDDLDRRLARLIAAFSDLARAHRRTLVTARTRGQAATPVSLGLKIATWLAPLGRHRRRLAELRPRVLVVQFGGAVGSLAVLGADGPGVMEALARELGLAAPAGPWASQRDGMLELGGWFALVSGSLGKLGQDLILLAQSEVREVRPGPGGGSSTLPHKANPVAAEMLVALARLNAGLLGTAHQAAIQEHERGGPGWTLEWLTLPQMAVATAAGLRHGLAIAAGLELAPERMAANLARDPGLTLAEAALYALRRHLPGAEAEALVAAACARAAAGEGHVVDLLSAETDLDLDWAALKDPANQLGAADVLIDRILDAAAKP